MLEDRISQLRELTFDQVAALPEVDSQERLVAGRKCTLTVYVQSISDDQLLLVVQLARPALLGIVSFHRAQGLVFARDGGLREATSAELIDSGG